MRWRTMAITLLLLLAVGASLALLSARQNEPNYRNQPLSFWVERYRGDFFLGRTHDDEARDALRAIGTNAFPFLLKWGSYNPPIVPLHLPDAAYSRIFRLLEVGPRAERSDAAILAFSAFGTNAEIVIPHLTNLLRNHPAAIEALARLGTQALPPLLMAWSNSTDQNERWEIESAVVQNFAPDEQNTNLVPLLISAMRQPTESSAASNALFQIAPQLATNTPAH